MGDTLIHIGVIVIACSGLAFMVGGILMIIGAYIG